MRGAQKARFDIHTFYKKKEEHQEELLKKFIENEPNACHANNLYRLLTKKWHENTNSYKICSKINAKNEKRIKDILVENRYSH